MEILAEVEIGEIGEVVPNDDARSSFTVRAGDSLLVLDANLTTVGQWPVGPTDCGWHLSAARSRPPLQQSYTHHRRGEHRLAVGRRPYRAQQFGPGGRP